MKAFKYFLALPLALTGLVSCNKGFSKSDFKTAKSITENYAKSIKNSKATGIVVGGHVNKITIDGDATWWSYSPLDPDEPEEGKMKLGAARREEKNPLSNSLISMIPNFSVKDSEIKVDSQDIASFAMPSSLMSFTNSAVSESTATVAFSVLANLPKFPMNRNLLRAINGMEKLPESIKSHEDWDAIDDKPWETAKVKYYTNKGRLKIAVEAEDMKAFMNELDERYFPEESKLGFNEDPSDKKYPGGFTITTSKVGYIDSMSIKLKYDDLKFHKEESDYLYVDLDANFELDVALKFEQIISDPVTLKYQLSVYHETEEDEYPDFEYPVDGTNPIPLTYDKEKSKGLTTSLEDFEEYLKFDWFSNTTNKKIEKEEEEQETDERVIEEHYDDPIFGFNYWNDNAKNIAFTNEAYDVLAYPVLESSEPVCTILGGGLHEFGEEADVVSHVTSSADGRVISTSNGLLRNGLKVLDAAGDAIRKVYFDKTFEEYSLADEIFINSNMLESKKTTYIVDIAIAIPSEE